MSINSSLTSAHLTRAEIWSQELKDILKDELAAQSYVRWLSEFPDGDQLNIPSIGEGTVRDYTEDTAVVYDPLDTGEFTFKITEYKQAGTYITKKARQDTYYAAELEASFVPKQARALAEVVETDILSLAAGADVFGQGGNQQAFQTNAINGADHRFVGTGTSSTIAIADFAKALYSLKKANVPDTGLLAIVDPSVEYTINTLANVIGNANRQPDENFVGLLQSGVGSGMRFVINLFGFNVFVSNYLPAAGSSQNGTETIGSGSVTSDGVCNIFMSAADERVR
ncbi:MAG: hypothetical protein D6746_06585, partial [Bacteroidetes bacterium]